MGIQSFKEHDPAACSVCMRLGDFTVETDTAEWMEEHAKIMGVRIRIEPAATGNIAIEEPITNEKK